MGPMISNLTPLVAEAVRCALGVEVYAGDGSDWEQPGPPGGAVVPLGKSENDFRFGQRVFGCEISINPPDDKNTDTDDDDSVGECRRECDVARADSGVRASRLAQYWSSSARPAQSMLRSASSATALMGKAYRFWNQITVRRERSFDEPGVVGSGE